MSTTNRSAPRPPISSNASVNGSKADFRALVAELRDPVIILNRLGTICFMNPAAKAFLMHGLGARLEEYLNKHRNKNAMTQVRFHLKGRGDVILKIARHRIQWIGKPAVLVSMQDVTQYVKAATRMRDSNLRTLSLLERVSDASYVIDVGDGTPSPYLSPQFDSLLGHERSSWRDDPLLWRKFIHDDDRQIVLDNVARAVRERKPFTAEYRMSVGNGEVIWVREQARIIEDMETDLLMLSGFLADITQEKSISALPIEAAESTAHQEKLTRVEHELAESRKAQIELQEKEDQRAEELKKRTAELATVTEDMARQADEHKEAVASSDQIQARIAELETVAEQLKANRGELDERLKQSLLDLEKIAEQLSAESAQRQQAEERAEELQQRLVEANQAMEGLQTERSEVDAARDERIAELEKAREKLQNELAVSAQVVEDLKVGQRHLKDQWNQRAAELKKSSEDLRKEVAESRHAAEEAESVQASLKEETSKQIAELEETRKQLERDLAKAEKAASTSRASCDKLEAKLQQHRDDLKRTRRELSLRTDAANRTEETLREYRARFEEWARKSAAELLMASEHLRHELVEEAQAEDPPEPS